MKIKIKHNGDWITVKFNSPHDNLVEVKMDGKWKIHEMTESSSALALLLDGLVEKLVELHYEGDEDKKEEDFKKPDEPPYGATFVATMECSRNFKMDSGEIAFTKGSSYDFYQAQGDFWAVDDQNDGHWMEITDIAGYFVFREEETNGGD